MSVGLLKSPYGKTASVEIRTYSENRIQLKSVGPIPGVKAESELRQIRTEKAWVWEIFFENRIRTCNFL